MDKHLIKELKYAHKKISTAMCPKCLTKNLLIDSHQDKVFCTKCRIESKMSEFVKRQNAATYEFQAKYGTVRR